MIKSLGKLLTIPKYHDFNENINNDDGYELVALINANLYFIFGILFNNTSFTSLTINDIKTLISFNVNEYIHRNPSKLITYLTKSEDINDLKSKNFIGYMTYTEFEENYPDLVKKYFTL